MGEQDTGELKKYVYPRELTKRFRNLYKAATDYWGVQGFNKIADLMLQIDTLDSNHYSDLLKFRSEYTDLKWNEKVELFRAGAASLPVNVFDDARNLLKRASETTDVQILIWTQGEIEEQSEKPHSPFGGEVKLLNLTRCPSSNIKCMQQDCINYLIVMSISIW